MVAEKVDTWLVAKEGVGAWLAAKKSRHLTGRKERWHLEGCRQPEGCHKRSRQDCCRQDYCCRTATKDSDDTTVTGLLRDVREPPIPAPKCLNTVELVVLQLVLDRSRLQTRTSWLSLGASRRCQLGVDCKQEQDGNHRHKEGIACVCRKRIAKLRIVLRGEK